MAVDLRRLLREVDSGAVTSSSGAVSIPRITAPVSPVGTGRRKYWVAAAVVAAALLAGASLLWKPGGGPPRPTAPPARAEIKSLAVLPLDNLSQDPAQEYFADGMTDELIARLSKISALRVISRTSAMRYKGSKKALPEIARELQVDAVVEGSVLRSGNRVRINARLIDAAERQMWSESYDRELRDILSI
jgi:TolB-like protein